MSLTVVDATCTGIDDGVIHIDATQGSPPFVYQWNAAQDSNYINDLAPGVYQGTITDANGCIAITDFFLIEQTVVVNYFVVDVNATLMPRIRRWKH